MLMKTIGPMLRENLQTVRENKEIFIKASKDIGLQVNSEKTKIYYHFSPTECSTIFSIYEF